MAIKKKRKAIIIQDECVACGCCENVCPKDAIKIEYGIYATVVEEKCIGCGKCKNICPASVIQIEEVKE